MGKLRDIFNWILGKKEETTVEAPIVNKPAPIVEIAPTIETPIEPTTFEFKEVDTTKIVKKPIVKKTKKVAIKKTTPKKKK